MNRNHRSRPAPRSPNDSGQAIVLAALALLALLGMAGFTIDVGRVLEAQRQLQTATDAAAMAGAMDLPASTATTTAIAYSANATKKNSHLNLPGVSMATGYPLLRCLTSTGLPCSSPSNANALVVKQVMTVQMVFASLIGLGSIDISATATASMRGGIPTIFDVIVIVDTTASMDNNCTATVAGVSNPSRLDCAKAGVRVLLNALWPCAQSLASCGTVTAGNVANPVDRAGLMIFGGLKSGVAVSKEYDCTSNLTSSNIQAYASSPNYSIVPLSSDYRTSDTASLNGSGSNIVKAVDWADGAGCSSSSYGLEDPGGVGSYFAGAITAAQASLVANARTNVQRAIIFLSDGDASGSSTSNGCHNAITAADAAATATPATWVYSVAYGAASSGGCTNDTVHITPLATMQGIASDSAKFFNQPTAGDLTAIFQKIVDDLTTTRLLPDDVS